MYFNRMDVCEAWYLFLTEYHEGQFSYKYKRLSKLQKFFKPSINFKYSSLSDNGKEIYHHLIEEEEGLISSELLFDGEFGRVWMRIEKISNTDPKITFFSFAEKEKDSGNYRRVSKSLVDALKHIGTL